MRESQLYLWYGSAWTTREPGSVSWRRGLRLRSRLFGLFQSLFAEEGTALADMLAAIQHLVRG
jgi:hypothetical protein